MSCCSSVSMSTCVLAQCAPPKSAWRRRLAIVAATADANAECCCGSTASELPNVSLRNASMCANRRCDHPLVVLGYFGLAELAAAGAATPAAAAATADTPQAVERRCAARLQGTPQQHDLPLHDARGCGDVSRRCRCGRSVPRRRRARRHGTVATHRRLGRMGGAVGGAAAAVGIMCLMQLNSALMVVLARMGAVAGHVQHHGAAAVLCGSTVACLHAAARGGAAYT